MNGYFRSSWRGGHDLPLDPRCPHRHWGSAFSQGNVSGFGGAATGSQGLHVRCIRETSPEGLSVGVWLVQIKGRLPLVRRVAQLQAVVHAFDAADGAPLMCVWKNLQEPTTLTFCSTVELGARSPGEGTTDWMTVGLLPTRIMIPPIGGSRSVHVVLRLVDCSQGVLFSLGQPVSESHPGLIFRSGEVKVQAEFGELGYREVDERRDEALGLAVSVGVCVALSDGKIAESEAKIITDWIERLVSSRTGADREQLRVRLKESLRVAVQAAKQKQLRLSTVLEQIPKTTDHAVKCAVLQLALDVLVADSNADVKELRATESIIAALGLDANEVARMRDRTLMGVNAFAPADADGLLGIKQGWSTEEIRAHLRREFKKWNGRISALPEGQQREAAVRMTELIAEAAKRYG